MARINFSHGGNVYEFGRRQKMMIDFSSNINPLGLPLGAEKIIYKSVPYLLRYPDPDSAHLRTAIARRWGIDDENVLCGNGSIELIYLVMAALEFRNITIPMPSFSEYERAAFGAGVRCDFINLKEDAGFFLPPKAANIKNPLLICNPNNPTGNMLIMPDFADRMKAGLLIVDEAFLDFVPNEEKLTFIRRAASDKRVIVLRTFTKFFAMAGLRLGYLVAHKETIARLKRNTPPWNINYLAQVVGEKALADKAYAARTRELIKGERDFLYKGLGEISGIKFYASAANFILICITRPGVTAPRTYEHLLKDNILIRRCGNFRNLSDRFIRVAVKNRSENKLLIKALKKVIG